MHRRPATPIDWWLHGVRLWCRAVEVQADLATRIGAAVGWPPALPAPAAPPALAAPPAAPRALPAPGERAGDASEVAPDGDAPAAPVAADAAPAPADAPAPKPAPRARRPARRPGAVAGAGASNVTPLRPTHDGGAGAH